MLINNRAFANNIGGPDAGDGNVISANAVNGIEFTGAGVLPAAGHPNIVENNIIGLAKGGLDLIAGSTQVTGVLIRNGSTGNQIGTATDFNVISGNTASGVQIDGAMTTVNTIVGNYIGTDNTGAAAIVGNPQKDGVLITDLASENTIGGAVAGDANVISANTTNGIEFNGGGSAAPANPNIVENNIIGLAKGGLSLIPQSPQKDGVLIGAGSENNQIGTANDHNIISGNAANGVEINGLQTTGNTVIGNYIGTDNTGGRAIAGSTQADGVLITAGAFGNTIGGPAAGDANVLSANAFYGVEIKAAGKAAPAIPNIVENNFIGVAGDGVSLVPLSSQSAGVFINGGSVNNQIGTAADHNVISGNFRGVYISGVALGAVPSNNVVIGNYIGTDKTGMKALANTGDGVLIDFGASSNTIGGAAAGMGNVISGNGANGVEINGAATTLNNLYGNFIGTDLTGKVQLANAGDGVLVNAGANFNSVGGNLVGQGNIISGNTRNGVELTGAGTSGNFVLGNYIGVDVSGELAMANMLDGVLITAGALTNDIGGPLLGDGNIISANGVAGAPAGGNGIEINTGSNGNTIQGNRIGVVIGLNELGNVHSGIFVDTSNDTEIGGPAGPGVTPANMIAFNGDNGITIASGTGNLITQNSIFQNGAAGTGGIGIDLGNDGVTLNHAVSPTLGFANDAQNFPVITSALYLGPAGTDVIFTFTGTPLHAFNVELFDSPFANSTGHGEGKTYLMTVPVVTNAAGVAINPATQTSFFPVNVAGATAAPAGTVITATATDTAVAPAAGADDTSEFSQALAVLPGAPSVDNLTFTTDTHHRITGVVVDFNLPLSAATVTPAAFELFSAGKHGVFNVPIALATNNALVYNANADTVTITTKKPLRANHFIDVFVNGTAHAVTNVIGTPLDGEFTGTLPTGNGIPGGDFNALIADGTHFAYKDSHTNTVSLTLSHGGSMELIRTVDGEGRYLELASVISGKTVLSGKVSKGRTGTGMTTLEGITGLGGAVDRLPPAEFTVGNSKPPTLAVLATSEKDLLAPWAQDISASA